MTKKSSFGIESTERPARAKAPRLAIPFVIAALIGLQLIRALLRK